MDVSDRREIVAWVSTELDANPLLALDPEWRAKVAKASGFYTAGLLRETKFEEFVPGWSMRVKRAQQIVADTPEPEQEEPVFRVDLRDWPKKG